MSRIREGYVNANQGADWAKAERWDINRLWFESDDPKSAVSTANKNKVGIKMNGFDADAMHQALTDKGFGPTTGAYTCGAMFDYEQHDPLVVLHGLQRWRQLRSTRYTIWTMEPWQEQWFDDVPGLIPQINGDANLLLAIQDYMDYNGDQLYPAHAVAAERRMVRMGINPDRITHFLAVKGGVQQPYGWEGIWWTFDALPASPVAPL